MASYYVTANANASYYVTANANASYYVMLMLVT